MRMALEPQNLTGVQEDAEYKDMRWRFCWGLLLTLPVVALANFHFFNGADLLLSEWLQCVFATPVVLWAGWPFFERGWFSLVNRSLNMFTLIALGIGVAYLSSVAILLLKSFMPALGRNKEAFFVYFEASAMITVLVLLGQVLELKAKSRTGDAIKALLSRSAKIAHLIKSGGESDIPVDEVAVGDILRVKPGEKIPTDGQITEGTGLVDESMISGESSFVEKHEKCRVIGGTINQTGSFLMAATQVGSQTVLSKIIQMVMEARRSRAPIQKLADQVSGYFVPIVLAIAFSTYLIWAVYGPEPSQLYAMLNAVAVLIIACPCALGLATPMSIMVGVGRGAEMGVLIKNAESLEMLEKVDTIVVDKTGTLTAGRPQVIQIITEEDKQSTAFLRLAASVERDSEHPLAFAVLEKAKELSLMLAPVEGFESVTGEGVAGKVEGKNVLVGKALFLEKKGVKGLDFFKVEAGKAQEQGYTAMFVAVNEKAVGVILVADPIKPTTSAAINALHAGGLKVIMLTGDNSQTAHAVGKTLKIDEVHAGVNPKEKHILIRHLKKQGRIVAMAGDGVNDAPALAEANVGIAMGTGTDVAMESAGVTLVKGDLMGIVRAIALSRATIRNIRQNLFFAFLYNILSIPIAAGILYPFFGILLNPMIASAAMSLSSVSVILNAMRLRYANRS